MARRATLTPVLEPRLSALVDALPAALAGEPAAVHQARVASRRLRDVVPVLNGLDAAERRRAARRLRRLTRSLGQVREADVSAALFAALDAERALPPLACGAVREALSQQRTDALRRLRRTWSHKRLARLHGVLDAMRLAADTASRPAARLAAVSRLDARLRRTRRTAGALGVLYAADRLHAVRIAVKRWRYTLELVTDLGRGRPPSALGALRAVQDDLGRVHDLHVLADLIRAVEARVVTRSRPAARDLRSLARRLDVECRALHAAFLLKAPLAGLVPPRASGARLPRPRAAA